MSAELSPEDLDEVELVMWSDADWAGYPEDSKSTAGLLLEFMNPNNGRRWPTSWSVKRRASTSNLIAEAETVAVCHAVKHEGLPTLILLEALFASARRPLELVGEVDNTQAITVVHKGYSKKLRFLERTHKSAIGTVNELNKSGGLVVEYALTFTHRGDGFTQCLTPAKFFAAREMMGLVPNVLSK